jgi:hypothetical protein
VIQIEIITSYLPDMRSDINDRGNITVMAAVRILSVFLTLIILRIFNVRDLSPAKLF